MTPPSWSYILPSSPQAAELRRDLAAAKYLLLESCVAIEGYRLSAFTCFGDLRAYLTGREEAGYAATLVAVTRLDKTLLYPQTGTPVPLEDLLR